MPCEDNNTALWLLLDNVDEVIKEFPRDWMLGITAISADLRKYGCDYLAFGTARFAANSSVNFPPYVGGINMCTGGGSWFPLKPYSYVCPVACGCRSGDAHCPGTCPSRTASTPRCPEHQRINGLPTGGQCPPQPPRSLFHVIGNHT